MVDEVEDKDEREAVGAGRTLGIERWVQFGFIAFAAIAFWLSDKIIFLIWDQFAEPDATLVAASAAVVGVVAAWYAYKREDTNTFAHEAVAELSKVTWPTRKETWHNTVVTVIVSIIAAGILFAFDATWSAITDLIYKV
jgi:preprotein translocase subunit SecE